MRPFIEYVIPILLVLAAYFGFKKIAFEKHWPWWTRIISQLAACALFLAVVMFEYFSGHSLSDMTREMVGSSFCKLFPISNCPEVQQAARERVAREARDQAAREQGIRERATREQAAREALKQAARDQAAQKRATREQIARTPPNENAAGKHPILLGQYGSWEAYAFTGRMCYALAKPASERMAAANPSRDPTYIFISTRPAENVWNEISIVAGYPYKLGSEASIDIGSTKYAMYTQADGAWIKNAAQEGRMIEDMRRGFDMVVSGESDRGTRSTDRYLLNGLAQALDRVAQECK